MRDLILMVDGKVMNFKSNDLKNSAYSQQAVKSFLDNEFSLDRFISDAETIAKHMSPKQVGQFILELGQRMHRIAKGAQE